MRLSSFGGVAAIAICSMLGSVHVGRADEAADIRQFEEARARFERRNESLRAYIDLLERVKDRASAKEVAPQLRPAAKQLARRMAEMKAAAAATKPLRRRSLRDSSSEVQRRILELTEQNENLESEWRDLLRKPDEQNERISQLDDLPGEFWAAFDLEALRVFFALSDLEQDADLKERPLAIRRFLRQYYAMMNRHGAEKTVQISVSGSSDATISNFQARLRKAAGSEVELASIAAIEGHSLAIASVEKFADLVAAIPYGEVYAHDEVRRTIDVDVSAYRAEP